MIHRFRGFELLDRIGSGGMSTIYLGVQTALDRKVAIKLLHPAFAHDDQFIARFEREAKSASSLGHPNVVTIIDFGSENGAYYIVMELVDGADLRSIFQRCDLIPPEITLAILEEICHGLEAAHEKGIVHRDIKPGNVLLSSDGRIKVADFGLARQINDLDRLSNITMTGAVVGTPAYMSPEQLAGAPVDHRTDIYSLGVMAYEFFVGERPFRTTPSGVSTEERILRGPVPPMERDGIRLPTYIVELVSRMLAKAPERRFQSVTELLRAIENAMEQIDDSGQLLKHRRDYLKRFAQDPPAFGRELRRRRLHRHLRRADHFVGLGRERLDDAVEEYLAALRIDPENPVARQAIDRLEREHGRELVDTVITRTTAFFRAEEVNASDATTARPAPAPGRGTDPLLDAIDAGDDADLVTRAAFLPVREPWPNDASGAEVRTEAAAPTTPGGRSEGEPETTLPPVDRAARNGTTPPEADDVDSSAPARPFWTRPWIWAALVGTLIAVPSLTLLPRSDEPNRSRESTVITNASQDLTSSLPTTPARANPTPELTDIASGRGTGTETASGTARSESESATTTALTGAPQSSHPEATSPVGAGTSATEATSPKPAETRHDARETPADGARAEPGGRNAASDLPHLQSPRDTTVPSTQGLPARGFIEVRVVPIADIYVDGELVGRKARVAVHPADPERPHLVEVRHPAFGVHRWPGVWAARDTTQLVHRYQWGDLRVEWNPPGPALVRFDQVESGPVPSFSRQVAAGEHGLAVHREGFRITRVQIVDALGTRSITGPDAARTATWGTIDVGPGQTTRVEIDFAKE